MYYFKQRVLLRSYVRQVLQYGGAVGMFLETGHAACLSIYFLSSRRAIGTLDCSQKDSLPLDL
jgi:hypothetical protein